MAFNDNLMDDAIGIMLIFLLIALYIAVIFMKDRFQSLDDTSFKKILKWLSLAPFVFYILSIVIFFGTVLLAPIIQWYALLVVGIVFYLGIASVVVGPAICGLGLLFSIAFTKRLSNKRSGVKYIVFSSLSLAMTLGIVAYFLLLFYTDLV